MKDLKDNFYSTILTFRNSIREKKNNDALSIFFLEQYILHFALNDIFFLLYQNKKEIIYIHSHYLFHTPYLLNWLESLV